MSDSDLGGITDRKSYVQCTQKLLRKSSVVIEKVSDMARKSHGCTTKHPCQGEHMETVCLASWVTQREMYMEECLDKVSSLEVLCQFKLSTDATDYHAASLLRSLKTNTEFKRFVRNEIKQHVFSTVIAVFF
jgi:hypothetical protein